MKITKPVYELKKLEQLDDKYEVFMEDAIGVYKDLRIEYNKLKNNTDEIDDYLNSREGEYEVVNLPDDLKDQFVFSMVCFGSKANILLLEYLNNYWNTRQSFEKGCDNIIRRLEYTNTPISFKNVKTAWNDFVNRYGFCCDSYVLNSLADWYGQHDMNTHAISILEFISKDKEYIENGPIAFVHWELACLYYEEKDIEKSIYHYNVISEEAMDLMDETRVQIFTEHMSILKESKRIIPQDSAYELFDKYIKLRDENDRLRDNANKSIDSIIDENHKKETQQAIKYYKEKTGELWDILSHDTREYICRGKVLSKTVYAKTSPDVVAQCYCNAIENEIRSKYIPRCNLPSREAKSLAISKMLDLLESRIRVSNINKVIEGIETTIGLKEVVRILHKIRANRNNIAHANPYHYSDLISLEDMLFKNDWIFSFFKVINFIK